MASRDEPDLPEAEAQHYESLNPSEVTRGIIVQLWRHAALVWVALPMFTLAQGGLVPVLSFMEPTCTEGYNRFTLAFVAMILGHHLFSEGRAWTLTKSLLSPPEVTVMRNLGILRRRRRLVFLGVLEDLSLYSNLVFPWVARSCGDVVDNRWLAALAAVPVPFVGPAVVALMRHLHFWGCASVLCAIMVLTGLLGFFPMTCTERLPRPLEDEEDGPAVHAPPMRGEDFIELARFAESAMTPSVASLCREIGLQRRWVLDLGHIIDGSVSTRPTHIARQKSILGKLDHEALQAMEINDQEAHAKVDFADAVHLAVQLLVKVLVSVVIQVWLQASFFGLSFEESGLEAKCKVVAGMAISVLLVLMRFCYATSSTRLGCGTTLSSWFTLFALLSVLLTAWAAAKVYYVVRCTDHVWNLTTGCVEINS